LPPLVIERVNISMCTLFDSNKCFGNVSGYVQGFRNASDLLANMDRFGISRSLVWNTEARDYSPTWGNCRLLEELKAQDCGERLVPAFTVSPVMLYEENAMDGLIQAMTVNEVRAIRVFPGTLRHSIGQIETLIDTLRKLKPVLFFDSKEREPLDARELLSLAEKFPDIPIVYMQGMWDELVTMLDLMRHRENILVDTSWLHTPQVIELITEKFGAERMVFGTGYGSHNGASIAALLYSDISESQRELIGHKNLERLLGLIEINDDRDTSKLHAAGLPEDESLWNRFISRKDLGLDIIDAHGHLGHFSTNIMKACDVEKQLEYFIPLMDAFNITAAAISGTQALSLSAPAGNRMLEEVLSHYGKKFMGYYVYNPYYRDEILSELDHCFSRDFFIGFKIHCHQWQIPVTDTGFEPLWEYAHRHCLPILLHTWEGNLVTPAMLEDIAPAYPNAIFILGHSGGGNKGRREAEELALRNGNVFLEFCGSFTASIPYEETVRRVGSSRVLFGTDAMFHSPVWELGRALSMNIPEEELVPIMGGNFRKILSLRR